MSGFILREVSDWNQMVKTAGIKLAQPAAPAMDPAAPKMEEGMPVADGRKPNPMDEKPEIAPEPTEYLQKEHKEIENAKAIVLQMWGLLTGEAGEGGYDEVKYLLDAIKSMEDFITVEETGVKPGKGKKSASFLRYAGKLKEYLTPIYEALVVQKEQLLGRPLTEQEDMAAWDEASSIGARRMKELAKSQKPVEEAPAAPVEDQQSGEVKEADLTDESTPEEHYEEDYQFAFELLGKIQEAMREHKKKFAQEPGNWGYAGDMKHIVEVLAYPQLPGSWAIGDMRET